MGWIKKTLFSAIVLAVVLLCMLPAACDKNKSRIYTVGIINVVPALDQSLVGFKNGMTKLGYIEGKNIRYSYGGATTDMEKLPDMVQRLLEAKIDLMLSITTPATLTAKQATVGIGLPVVFMVVTDPVGAGIVDSMRQPGGHITGVAFGIQEARRLEWLLRLAPKIKRIYVPYNPMDKSPVLALKMIQNAAAKLEVDLITREVYNPDMVNDAVLNIPAQADAVFLLPDSLMATRVKDMVATATSRKLPTSVSNISTARNYDVLMAYGFDQHLYGIQTARLVDQIFKGARPADLPVETAEFYLAVNLKVAKAIGLKIPDEILGQADFIIR